MISTTQNAKTIQNAKLVRLVEYLDSLTDRAPLAALEQKLTSLDINLSDVREFVQFNEVSYRRNLVVSGDWYHLLVLCWRSGQRSPIHDHAQSTCGLKVLSGVATETKFAPTPSGLIKAVSSSDAHSGEVCVSQDSDMHQVSNLQVKGNDLVTLHIYSPPLLKMRTYSLTDSTVGVYVPEIIEHVHGSGI